MEGCWLSLPIILSDQPLSILVSSLGQVWEGLYLLYPYFVVHSADFYCTCTVLWFTLLLELFFVIVVAASLCITNDIVFTMFHKSDTV